MRFWQKPLLAGAVVGPIIFLFLSIVTSGIKQVIWNVSSWGLGWQIFNAVTWGALLGAVTFNSYVHYKHNNFVRAKQLCLLFGVALSLIFLAGLLYRLSSVENFIPPSVKAMLSYNPSKSRWFALAFFESVALHWSLILLFVGLWLPNRNPTGT